ncbi:MAG: hypothetical protein WD649_06285, partial [Thermoleophilaceae bacterium]
MREGPLADLFRKTEDEGAESRSEQADTAAPERTEAAPRREGKPAGGQQPVQPRDERIEEQQQRARSEQRAAEQRRSEPRPLSEPDPTPMPEAEAPVIPSPEERLRNVFSSDIPENVMERPGERVADRPVAEPEPRIAPEIPTQPVLRVVGVGGAGVNAVNRMIDAQVEGVEFIALNTDLQSLEQSHAPTRLHIGSDATRGLGSGSDPELGRVGAHEDYDDIKALLKGADMV